MGVAQLKRESMRQIPDGDIHTPLTKAAPRTPVEAMRGLPSLKEIHEAISAGEGHTSPTRRQPRRTRRLFKHWPAASWIEKALVKLGSTWGQSNKWVTVAASFR